MQFRAWSENLCQILEQEGMLVRPYQLASLPFFQALSESEQRQAIHLIENYCAVCQDTLKNGSSLRDERAILDQALRHYDLQVDPEIFDFMGPEVVYEFYSANQTQFFRTANFFEYTSYTIEDLYSRSWMHLYDRDEKITKQIIEYAAEILTGLASGIIKPTLPEHLLTERASLERIKIPVRFECLAPLKQDNKTVGILCAVKSSGQFVD
jgi:hypothetical protein